MATLCIISWIFSLLLAEKAAKIFSFVNFISIKRKIERSRIRKVVFVNDVKKFVKLRAKFFKSGSMFSWLLIFLAGSDPC